MDFSWDPKKAELNVKKHGVSFEEAVSVFYDPFAKITNDPDHSQDEDRYILIGYSRKSDMLFIVHIYKEASNLVNIISARKATRKEKRDYTEILGK